MSTRAGASQGRRPAAHNDAPGPIAATFDHHRQGHRPMPELVHRAQQLAERYLEVALPKRFRHTAAVADRAHQLASRLLTPEHADIVVASAWLHDIGYAPDLTETGFHPIDGARFLMTEDEELQPVVGLVAHHTGAVFEAHERGLADQLANYPVDDILGLAILTCADLCAGPDGTAMDPADRIDEVLARYAPDQPVHRAIIRSAPFIVTQADLILAAAAAGAAPHIALPAWVELEPFAPHWYATWSREHYRITAINRYSTGPEMGVEITLTDPLEAIAPAAAETMADDLRTAAAAAAGEPLHWVQYSAFASPFGTPVPDHRESIAARIPFVSTTFRLQDIIEYQWDMASEDCVATVDQRVFTTLSDVTEWTALLVAGRRVPSPQPGRPPATTPDAPRDAS